MVNSYPVGEFTVDKDRCWNVEVVEAIFDASIFYLIGEYTVVEGGTPYSSRVIIAYGDSREELLVWADINNLRMRGKDEKDKEEKH